MFVKVSKQRMEVLNSGRLRCASAPPAHPTRIFIVETLEQSELTVGKLCEAIGIAQSNASQHLAVLRSTTPDHWRRRLSWTGNLDFGRTVSYDAEYRRKGTAASSHP
jgi:DNA-binding transcriptional ArsR family regulator